ARQAGGYKATINNPQRSEETKQAAREKLDDLESKMVNDDGKLSMSHDGLTAGKNTGNVLGGYKATLKNPRVSEEAKQNAKQVLVEHDAL
ncbi:Conidiation protein 6-domain-containing protein, partial [Crepidotus variabilis]